MALDGFIFDLDGTLIDTNAMHVEAWRVAFERSGYRVPNDRILVEIGKGGDHLVPDLLGEETDRQDGAALRKAQPQEFSRLAQEKGIRPFPQAQALVEAIRGRGIKVVLATSSGKQQLAAAEEASGLPITRMFDAIVNADDIEKSKPSGDAVVAAVKKLGLSPAQVAMLGDTPYDAEAAKKGGVVCLGVECGGFAGKTLRSAGARNVYRDPADLLERLDEALRLASPGHAHLTQRVLEGLMLEALSTAREGMSNGEAPIGAALATGDGTVIAHGFNQLIATQNKTAHAEIVVFGRAAGKAPVGARDLILVSTLEPCVMCLGAAMEAAVDTIVYALPAPADGGTHRVIPPQSPDSQMPRIVGNILAQQSRALFEQWLQRGEGNPEQAAFAKQLLGEAAKER